MTQATLPRYSFSGHETFPFRYAWPTKGVRKATEYPDLFIRDDAIAKLGVGKNMVGSIKHWCDTLGLIVRDATSGHVKPTALGSALLGVNGWDAYLENPGTLWLLHWKLVSRKDKASLWYLAFTRWSTEEFNRSKLAEWAARTAKHSSASSVTEASIQRDVDVFIRTYVPASLRKNAPIEDSFDCPLVELGLIRELGAGTGSYQFERGPKPTLPNHIFLFALLEYWQDVAPHGQTLSFESILHGPGSPGAAFKLSENALAERLEALPTWSKLHYDDTAGMRVVLKRGFEAAIDPLWVLEAYYSGSTKVSEGASHV